MGRHEQMQVCSVHVVSASDGSRAQMTELITIEGLAY